MGRRIHWAAGVLVAVLALTGCVADGGTSAGNHSGAATSAATASGQPVKQCSQGARPRFESVVTAAQYPYPVFGCDTSAGKWSAVASVTYKTGEGQKTCRVELRETVDGAFGVYAVGAIGPEAIKAAGKLGFAHTGVSHAAVVAAIEKDQAKKAEDRVVDCG